MKIALAQIAPQLGNQKKNIEKHIEYCERAIAEKAELIIFPELSLTGYSVKDCNTILSVNPFTEDDLEELVKISENIDIIFGFVEENERFDIFNSAAYLSKQKYKHIHRKIYPPDYGMFEEMRYFNKGVECKVFETPAGKAGMLICEDMWHISMPYTLAMGGAYFIYGIAASPTRLTVDTDEFNNYKINSEHHKTFARLLSTYIIFVNRTGYEDGVNFWGGSEVIDPFGNILAVGKLFDEDLIFADISAEEVKRARHQARHFNDEDTHILFHNLNNVNKVRSVTDIIKDFESEPEAEQ